jgi:D-3-phosphoglycerate dehydrogenase / 2-oxoglutarate reductase
VADEPNARPARILLAFPLERRPLLYPDAALDRLRSLGTVDLSRTTADSSALAWIEEAGDADVVVLDRVMDAPALAFDRLPRLRALVRPAIDVRSIDQDAASAHGVLVAHGTAGWVDAVCELIVGLSIALLRFVPDSVCAYRAGNAPPIRMGRQLSGASLGVIGYGNLGRRMAELGAALNMQVRISDPFVTGLPGGLPNLGLHELLAASDVVVCVASHTPATTNLVDESAFAVMRPGAIFINASRGALVDDAALVRALRNGPLAGAGLDVGRGPDDRPDPDIAALPNVVAVPHVGGMVPQAVEHHALESVEQVARLLNDEEPVGALNWAAAARVHEPRGGAR